MRLTSFYVVTVVLLLFLTIQGWLINKKFISPQMITVEEAVLVGVTAEVRSPMPGQIASVLVQEGDSVESGQELFTMIPLGQRRTIPVVAQGNGIVTDIKFTQGAFVQPTETLATVVDNTRESLFVQARLRVDPEDVQKIRPRLLGVVQADYLSDGEPLEAMVVAVDPMYNAKDRTIDVRLQLTELPEDFESITTGLPVSLAFEQGANPLQRLFSVITSYMAPPSVANE